MLGLLENILRRSSAPTITNNNNINFQAKRFSRFRNGTFLVEVHGVQLVRATLRIKALTVIAEQFNWIYSPTRCNMSYQGRRNEFQSRPHTSRWLLMEIPPFTISNSERFFRWWNVTVSQAAKVTWNDFMHSFCCGMFYFSSITGLVACCCLHDHARRTSVSRSLFTIFDGN